MKRDLHPGLHLLATAVALLMLLPVAWLLLHAWDLRGQGSDAVEAFWSEDTQEALWNGVDLAAWVALACVAVSIPLAWLTHATDLPGRRFFRAAPNQS